MQTPIAYPFTDFATWIAGVGPSISADFLSQTQRGLADLYGALLGRSAVLELDDFTDRVFPAGQLGSLTVLTNTNAPGLMAVGEVVPAAAGEYGVARVVANNAAAYSFNAEGVQVWLDEFDFVWSARVKIIKLASLESVGNRGFQVGLFSDNEGAATSCRFLAGNDEANWIARVGATDVDSGVPIVDGQWYDVQMSRISGNVTAYVDGALVATVAHAVAMNSARRRLGSISPGAAVGEGFQIDYFKSWMQR